MPTRCGVRLASAPRAGSHGFVVDDQADARFPSQVSGAVQVRAAQPADRAFIRAEAIRHWDCPTIRSRDVPYEVERLPALVAWLAGQRVGHLTYSFLDSNECEVVTLSATVEDRGVGTALLSAAIDEARRHGCRRVFLTTTNDNLRALRFYQRRGWRLVAVLPGMIDRYRERGKAIPEVGLNDIPLHDEIELEYRL